MSRTQSIPPRKNLGVSNTSEPPLKIAAPSIANLSLEEAKDKIATSGFRHDIEYLIDDTQVDGLILGQYPPAGALRRENGKIKILVNSRSSSIMPDLIGKTEAEATALLQDLQISFVVTRIDTPQALYSNKIFYQSSPYGAILARNVAVVNLSLGNYVPATIGSLPNVVGLTYDLAIQQMSVAGFSNFQRILDTANTQEYLTKNGTVKEQFPPGGQTAAFTQVVQIKTFAYSGIIVPNLSGLSVSEAQSQLSALGLNYLVGTSVNTSNSTLGNKISSQSPAAGSPVVAGSTVTYNYYTYVYVAPTPVPVPTIPDPPQNSSISGISISGTTCTISGSFPQNATNISVNGNNMGSWSYSSSSLSFSVSPYAAGTLSIQVYNGRIPLLPAQSVYWSGASTPTPPAVNPTPPTPPIAVAPTPPVVEPIAVYPPIDIPPIDLPPIGGGGKSIGINTLVRTPEGLVAAKDLRVGDKLISADIASFPTEGFSATDLALAWRDSTPEVTIVETEIADITRKMSSYAVVINADLFSDSHYIFAKRNGEAQFIMSLDIEQSDLIYSYVDQSWVPITTLEKIEVSHEIISINCEPYDIFFTENMLTHDSHRV